MHFGLAYLLLVCLLGMAVSEYRKREETKDERGWIANGPAANFNRLMNLGRWWKRRFSQRETARERLAEAFNTLDVNEDGFVDMDELKDDFQTVLKGYTREPGTLMRDTDKNKDGKIDFEEFFAELSTSNGQM